VQEGKGICWDPEDDKFISCALSGSAAYFVSGDKDLSHLKNYKGVKIVKVAGSLKMFD
jgi:predicted nucleic acid-binding protein